MRRGSKNLFNLGWNQFNVFVSNQLRDKQACSTGGLDLLFCQSGEELGLDNYRDIDLSITQKLEVSELYQVNHRGLASSVLGSLVVTFPGNTKDLVEVDRRAVGSVLQDMELAHTNLTEVTRVIFIHKNSVVMLSSGVTATTGVLSVLSDTSVTGGDVSSLLTVLVASGRHDEVFIFLHLPRRVENE